jgi:hypothetical protein
MKVWAATQAHVRDPNIIKRRVIDEQMRVLAKTHIAMPGGDPASLLDPEEDVIWVHKQVRAEMEKLQAELKDIPNKSAAAPKKWAKGARESFLRELMDKFKISRRLVIYCINNF